MRSWTEVDIFVILVSKPRERESGHALLQRDTYAMLLELALDDTSHFPIKWGQDLISQF
jgi:hypothetical protein